ncbi:MAG TPA: hypothetical protein VFA52_02000 [Candidatus Paceibacterota bacterium]|nr:hypothetical protein [Candidatus Paceibacterota bacterium]
MKRDRGFVALISVILISSLLIPSVLNSSEPIYEALINIYRSAAKAESEILAESCVEVTFVRLAQNPNYSGSSTIEVGSSSCEIVSVKKTGNQYDIFTGATSSKVSTILNSQVFWGDNGLKITSP